MTHEKILAQHIKEFEIKEYIKNNLKRVGYSSAKLMLTPLGEKIVISASRPGLIVGKRGQSIKQLTNTLKKKFNLENPQIEISEVTNPNLDPIIIGERVVNSMEKFGSARFKGIGHKAMEDVMGAGALGVEILISGKIPSSRAKRWRFYQGYLKKSGDIAVNGVRVAYTAAELKSGTVGIQVRIMPPDLILPDDIRIKKKSDLAEVEKKEEAQSEAKSEEEAKPKQKKAKKEKKKQESTENVITKESTKTAIEESATQEAAANDSVKTDDSANADETDNTTEDSEKEIAEKSTEENKN
ncbi:30S ribosomal protein S3 [Candidatus Woesearchaeota archaeon]|nr:30S ribosomal protein S3 [Candidatus Woesearchaeota archaeon]